MIFDSWTDEYEARWACLRAFLKKYYGVAPALPSQQELEADLGISLRGSVLAWVQLLEGLAREGRWRDVFRDNRSFDPVPDIDALSILVSGEDDVHWGVLWEHTLSMDDPPVHFYNYDYFGEHDTSFVEGGLVPTLTEWALDYWFTYLSDHKGSSKVSEYRNNKIQPGASSAFPVVFSVAHATVLEDEGMLAYIGPMTTQGTPVVKLAADDEESMKTLRERIIVPWVP
ncbi:MAG: hypothetical protein AAGE52_36085 [Myxococcota bacterium]